MKAIRLILILLVGGPLIYLTYKSKYQTFFFDVIIWAFLIFLGLILIIWSIVKELKIYRSTKQVLSFSNIMVSFLLATVVLIMEYNINSNFDKPSLLKVFYDGDYNGTAIDFKTDGTYIFDNSAIGLSNFQYGTYKITGNKIVIDKHELDKVVLTNTLEVRKKKVEYSDSTKNEKYLYQVSDRGQVIENTTEFRVVVDNRHD